MTAALGYLDVEQRVEPFNAEAHTMYRCELRKTRRSSKVYDTFPWTKDGVKDAADKMNQLHGNGQRCTAVKVRKDDGRDCGSYHVSAELARWS